MVVAEPGPLIIENHQEQMGRMDAAQQRRRVPPRRDGRTRVRGHLAQDGGVQHELGNLEWLLLEDLRDEELGDLMAADIQRSRDSAGVLGATKRQRRHLQRRCPPLASLMKQFQVSSGNLDAEVCQQVTALGQREVQVTVAKLAQLTCYPQLVQPHLRVGSAGQHELRGLGWPAFHEIGHVSEDARLRGMEVVHNDH